MKIQWSACADKFGCRIVIWTILVPLAERYGFKEVKR